MSTFLDNIADLRYDPFTQIYTPYGYGYSGNPKEVHIIPASSPYQIHLDEIPKEDSPSTLFINEQGGSPFTEVSFTTVPAAGQFRVTYGGDGTTTQTTAGQGIVEFNVTDAGKTMEVKYFGLGNILQKQFINEILKIANPFGTIIAIHPDTKAAYLPDSEYWSPCDGVASLDTTYIADTNDTKVPDLTDDRFLMGDTAYKVDGSNTKDLEHNHAWFTTYNDKDVKDTTYDSAGTESDMTVAVYPSVGSGLALFAGVKNSTLPAMFTGSSAALDAYTNKIGSTTQDILPQYFSVLYYIRIT